MSQKDMTDLVQFEGENCVSIYLPGSDSRLKKGYGERFPEFTHQVKVAKSLLEEAGMPPSKIHSYLEPIRDFQSNELVYSRQAKGMVFFCQENYFSFFQLPIEVEACTFVGKHFYILPLISWIDSGRPKSYYLLRLALNKVELYKGQGKKMTEVNVRDILPESLREVVGEDFREKAFQKRSFPTGSRQSLYHGRGPGKDDKKPEIEKFFREVDRRLKQYLSGDSSPLVVDALPHLFSMFASIAQVPNFIPTPLPRALKNIPYKEIPDSLLSHIISRVGEGEDGMPTYPEHLLSENVDEILIAVGEGRVEKVLFPTQRKAQVKRVGKGGDRGEEERLNNLVIDTLKQGGEVCGMPESSLIKAVMRY